MSLLGKKRTKRENDDEKVRHNHIIFPILIFKKEYNQMFGIKEEEDQNDNTNKDSGENTNIQKEENKIENKEIKIKEMTFILPSNEKILQKNIRKFVKIEKEKEEEKDKPAITATPMETKEIENKTKIEIKEEKEIKKDNKKEEKNESVKKELNEENNIFKTKPVDNPFSALIDNNNNLEEKKDINKSENSTFNLFGNINNSNEIENNNDNVQQSLFTKTDIKVESKDNSKSLFSNTKSLFSGNNNGNSLFSGGNTKSLFSGNDGKPLFSDSNTLNNSNNKNLFSGTSLFSNNNGNSLFGPNLFSNNNIKGNPFSEIKGEEFVQSLFNNSNKNNDNNNTNNNKGLLFDYNQGGEDNEEEDERDKPKTVYASEPLKAQDYSDYSKLYNTHLYNLFLYRKSEKKFISKGSGFLSIEKTKDEKSEQHKAVIVFRNQTGNKLVEGFLDKNLNKFDIYNKDFNYVVCFGIVMMNDGKAEFGYIKIPFKSEENANALKDAFEKAISSINGKDTK